MKNAHTSAYVKVYSFIIVFLVVHVLILTWLALSVSADNREMMGDKLVLRGLKFHGFHGVKEEERKLGQKFLLDVDAWMDLQPAGNSDNLSDTVSYTAIYR